MSQTELNQITAAETTDSGWKGLYKSGCVAAIVMVVIIIVQFVVFIAWPPPLEGSVLDWFTLFSDNWLLGLLSFEVLMIVYTILSILITLALFIALKRVNKTFTAIYLVISIIGIIFFIAARPAFEMLSLSNQYVAAATDAERSILLSAGQVMLAVFKGTVFHMSYILGSISGLLISAVMLKSNIFSKSTAYIRIMSSILDFGLYIPVIGIFISMFSVVFLLIWNILIAGKLFKLANNK